MGTFIDSLPEDTKDPAYAKAILGRFDANAYDPPQWSIVTSTIPNHSGKFAVLTDSLKIDGIRFTVDAETNQVLADMLGALLITPRLSDLAWFASAKLPVVILSNTAAEVSIMSKTRQMVKHSQLIDANIAKFGASGIVRDIGKWWVLGNALGGGHAINYGAYSSLATENCVTRTMGPCKLFQSPGTRHDRKHVDYSQVAMLVSRQCEVDGSPRDLADILRDPELAPLVSHEGALTYLRQPGVALTACKVPGLALGPTGVGYGEDGKTVCPIRITGLSSMEGGSSSTGNTLLAVGAAAFAAWAGWEGWKWLRARRYV